MAVALLSLIQETPKVFDEMLFFGELGLDGTIKRVNGILTAVISAIKQGYTKFCIPEENSYELEYIPNIEVYPLKNFQQIVDFVDQGKILLQIIDHPPIEQLASRPRAMVDFADIKGHLVAKRAMSIAAAGQHNVLMVGAP